jgi:hypothetical protein
MSLIFNPEVRKCFAPCAESLRGEWCQCQMPRPVENVEVNKVKTFEEVAEAFKQQMIKENKDNAEKGDILTFTNVDQALLELEYHKSKLYFALKAQKPERVKEYLADCANFLLTIGNAWELY